MKSIILLGLMLWSTGSVAQTLYKEALMPTGSPYEGQPLNTAQIRGFVVIDGENVSLPTMDASYLYIANVTHNDKFYVARVAPDSPQKVSFVYEKFIEMQGGHGDLIYQLDPSNPMELIYEIVDTNSQKGYELSTLSEPIVLNEILLTGELVKVMGDETPLKEGGLNGSFAMAYRMTSIPERLIAPVLGEGRRTIVYDMNFDQKATQQSFLQTVLKQSYIGMSKIYHLISNNCITSAVLGLMDGLSQEEQAKVKVQISRTMAKLKTLSNQEITDEEINKMLQEYAEILGDKGENIKAETIHKKSYFLKWLNKDQLKRSLELLREQSIESSFFNPKN